VTISPKLPQLLISIPFLALGGWCLIAPASVERLFLSPQFQHNSATSAVLIGCFGAQAMISGLFAAFSQFRSITFIVYAIALLPFFAFNYYFVFVLPVFNHGMVVDFGANGLMLLICFWGYRMTKNAS
jgi:hypothetical protein